ncbi:hypothetical protein F4083_08000 [Candidatus Poribacteria bacterium]|nr:hypothetical protein [Candidatus Poribacteria bacterium]MYB66542.1 hypothetical protein [Candidatus Poribacteria bacterium]MYF54965.1 hypothetical protein [Candidatus Poribacteria bacterium]MYI94253.1 hypothetical protein [Candidatus Poribacteria bacterium]
MAYSNFTLDTARETFQLERTNTSEIFSDLEPVPPSALLVDVLKRKMFLATAIGTEKAKSEMIVADVLVELREHFEQQISLFSGIDFNVDEESGLTGVCDFLISLSPEQFYLEAPIIVVVEAKNDNLEAGLGQCVAEMVAAQRFNAEKGNDIPIVYGATTTGVLWRFLKLEGQTLSIDIAVYQIERCDKILGVLKSMVEQEA